MKFAALFLLSAITTVQCVSFDPELNNHWELFKKVFGKNYNGLEETTRRIIWEERIRDIVRHNLGTDLGLHKFKKGINEYSDMSQEEFVKHFNGLRQSDFQKRNGSIWLKPPNLQLPDKMDWRDEGFVTPLQNSFQCGSCWAFSATGSLEGQHKKKTGQLVALSVQNLVDCSKPQGNDGCGGGVIDFAFEYIKENNGIDTEESYPYTGYDGSRCLFKRADVGATCTGYVDISPGNEDNLKTVVATIGPISVAIDASHESFMSYKSGIYDEPECSSQQLDHGVLVVGYGTENGDDYWLVKNSWGTSWGIKGYIKMSRNKRNQCGIATQASYPVV